MLPSDVSYSSVRDSSVHLGDHETFPPPVSSLHDWSPSQQTLINRSIQASPFLCLLRQHARETAKDTLAAPYHNDLNNSLTLYNNVKTKP